MVRKRRKTLAVIVPIYNVEKYLADCIESLIQQTVPFDEILLIDDGSDDNSLDICKKYQYSNMNIKVYSHNNSGVSYTRNWGIDCCESDYLLFVDSDDMLKLDTVRIIKEKISKEDYDMLIYDADLKYENEIFTQKINQYDRSKWILENEMVGKDFLCRIFPECYSTIACMSVYKKEYLKDKNLYFQVGISYSEDMLFGAEALLSANLIYYLPYKLYIRRYRENSATTSVVSGKKVKDHFLVAERMSEIIWNHIKNKKDYNDKYISIALFHYNVLIYILNHLDNELISILNSDIKNLVYSLISFLNRTSNIWKEGNNLSNIQLAMRMIKRLKVLWLKNLVQNVEDLNKMEVILQEVFNCHLINKLCILPFKNKDAVVAIYGTGKMTDTILSMYREKINSIDCQIVFIKSEAKKNEIYGVYPVYSVENMPSDVQFIVISSYKYRKEMREALKAKEISGNLIDIYENEYFEVKLEELKL